MSIHPLAAISPDAHLGVGVKIAAFATVEADVELGDFWVHYFTLLVNGSGVLELGAKMEETLYFHFVLKHSIYPFLF